MIQRMIQGAGGTLDGIQAAHAAAEFDPKWAGRVPAKRFVVEVYYSPNPHFLGS